MSGQDRTAQARSACAVCGQPARYLFAYPSGSASVEVVYDGAPVYSPECARAVLLERGRTREDPEDPEEEGAE